VSADELVHLVNQYQAGLEAELVLLRQLEQVAARQRESTEAHDFAHLAIAGDERDRVTRSLLAIEQGLAEVRKTMQASQAEVMALEGFQAVLALRQQAAELVAHILATDRESLKSLADAELARRAALASLERGDTTLAAYRKVLAPPVSSAALLNRRG